MAPWLTRLACAAVVIGSIGLGPNAFASNESASFSSLDAGVPVSGSASTTVSVPNDNFIEIDLPASLFSTQTWAGTDPTNCAIYGITLQYSGVNQVIASCQSLFVPAGGSEPDFTALYVDAGSSYASIGDAITLSWGSAYATTLAPLSGATVFVRGDSYTPVAVTPLLSTPTHPIPMWQQSVGRASAAAACPVNFTPSWDFWPNGGTGGYVCNRFVPEYGN